MENTIGFPGIPDTRLSVIEEIPVEEFFPKNIRLYIKREDKIHDAISGNKWRKLKYNLGEAEKNGYHRLLTFGGAYSNHIYAMAAAGKIFGFETTGVIRGEPYPVLNPTLSYASENGMQLLYLSRGRYKRKYEPEYLEGIRKEYGDYFLIPEGGTNLHAIRGCIEMAKEIPDDFDLICLPCGTGGTLAGLLEGLIGRSFVIGFPVMRKGAFLRREIDRLTMQFSGNQYKNFVLNTRFHFNGYAKFNSSLIDFINQFRAVHHICLDPVYTGKMVYGIFDLIRNGNIKNNTRILIIHTGGLQGIRGFNERYNHIIREDDQGKAVND